VHLEFAGHFGQVVDEQEADLDLVFEPQFSSYPAIRPQAGAEHVLEAARFLRSAQRPVIVAGGGVAASMAQPEVVELAEMLGIPVATSLNGKGTIAENHHLSLGVAGTYSRRCANEVISEADLVFFIGSRTSSQVTKNWRIPPKGTPVMQLDIAPDELGRHYPNVASLCGDAKVNLRQLVELLKHREPNRQWVDHAVQVVRRWQSEVDSDRHAEFTPMRPERICKEVEAFLPADAILVSDTGHASFWTGAHIDIQPGQSFIRACGSLGWALPAALGAKCAQPQRPVICFTGDGGFYYHFAELETAARYGIKAVIVVNNNHSLNQEKEIFDQAYGGEQKAGLEMWQFKDLNLADIARAMGCHGERVDRPDGIRPALERALACGGPAVVDVTSDINALAPV
jgi:acetolactate synthase-1/2/3 large subunit